MDATGSWTRRWLPALVLASALALAGCSAANENTAPNQDATVLLDAQPGAVHAGIYTAVARGYDEALGAVLTIAPPPAAGDAAQQISTARAEFAVLRIEDLATARERGLDVVGVMAIVQRPTKEQPPAPPYPPLVLSTGRITLQDEPALVRATLSAISRGYSEVFGDPESAVSILLEASEGLDRATVVRELDAVSPDFTAGARFFGELDPDRLRAWATYAQRRKIVRKPPDVARMFEGRFVPRSGSRD